MLRGCEIWPVKEENEMPLCRRDKSDGCVLWDWRTKGWVVNEWHHSVLQSNGL